MEEQQAWPKRHQLLTVIAAAWCITSWMFVDVAATSGNEKTPKVVVQGVVYCEDAEVQVECTNEGSKAREIGRTNAQGTFTILLQDYDYETWGSNGCKAKLTSSLRSTTCTVPTNTGGGLTGTNLVLKEKSNEKVVLTAGPFAFKQSEVAATTQKNDVQRTVETKDSGSSVGSRLWYSPPNNNHYTPPPHYESPPYKSSEHKHEGRHRERHGHKSREKDCSPKRGSHHHESPVHHSPPYYYKSPPYHHDAPRHESSPYYKSPPYYPPPHHYISPPPASGYNHMSPPYTPYVHHTPSPPPHHDTYKAPPKQISPPPYSRSNNIDDDVKAAPAQAMASPP